MLKIFLNSLSVIFAGLVKQSVIKSGASENADDSGLNPYYRNFGAYESYKLCLRQDFDGPQKALLTAFLTAPVLFDRQLLDNF